jgi:hypothetical protein
MMTYDQAAVIIPKKDAYDYFERHGYRISKPNPTVQDISGYFHQVAKKSEAAMKDLESLANASAKKMGGCNCGGNCAGCSGKKTVTEPELKSKPEPSYKTFAQQHSALLIGGGILIALALILRK